MIRAITPAEKRQAMIDATNAALARDRAIIEAATSGVSFSEIGKTFNISAERVRAR